VKHQNYSVSFKSAGSVSVVMSNYTSQSAVYRLSVAQANIETLVMLISVV